MGNWIPSCSLSKGTSLLQPITLMDNGVLRKPRKLVTKDHWFFHHCAIWYIFCLSVFMKAISNLPLYVRAWTI